VLTPVSGAALVTMVDMDGFPAVVHPVEGFEITVVLPEVRGVLWWGPDERGVDVVAAAGGQALVWPSTDLCREDVSARGWAAGDGEPSTLDVRPLVAWLQGRRLALDVVAGLGAWNLAGDLSVAVGARWSDGGRLADVCFEKLTIANVPWLAGLEEYRPRWTRRQHTYLRGRLAQAVTLIRAQLLSADS